MSYVILHLVQYILYFDPGVTRDWDVNEVFGESWGFRMPVSVDFLGKRVVETFSSNAKFFFPGRKVRKRKINEHRYL